jgi:hypothetical protein
MQCLEVSGAVRPLKWPLGVKWLNYDARKIKHKIVHISYEHKFYRCLQRDIFHIPKSYSVHIYSGLGSAQKKLWECEEFVREAEELCRCCCRVVPSQLAFSSSDNNCIASSGSAPSPENNGKLGVKELRLGLLKFLLALQNPYCTNNLFMPSTD